MLCLSCGISAPGISTGNVESAPRPPGKLLGIAVRTQIDFAQSWRNKIVKEVRDCWTIFRKTCRCLTCLLHLAHSTCFLCLVDHSALGISISVVMCCCFRSMTTQEKVRCTTSHTWCLLVLDPAQLLAVRSATYDINGKAGVRCFFAQRWPA